MGMLRESKRQKMRAFIGVLGLLTITAWLENNKAEAQENGWQLVFSEADINALEVTPYGLLAGQKGFGTDKYNGVFISSDFGYTWEELGLRGHGITDIKVHNREIYASTYFYKGGLEGGLFYSEDLGQTWEHLFYNQPTECIGLLEETIFLGTRNDGLWISFDKGTTWKQAFEPPFPNLIINNIAVSEDVIFALNPAFIWESRDKGKTWKMRPYMPDERVISILIDEDTKLAYAGTFQNGLFVSTDEGQKWEEAGNLKHRSIFQMEKSGNILAAEVSEPGNSYSMIYTSKNQGITWEDSQLQEKIKPKTINDIAAANLGKHTSIFTASEWGITKKEIEYEGEGNQFIGKLWRDSKGADFVEKITSFFDHKYPLLGYTIYPEPSSDADSTVNFFGYEGTVPKIYYTSHNGFDFGLDYGTEIIAPADGTAKYYYCTDCGNSIKIDHENGYETTYMHLQRSGLVAKPGKKVHVEKGDVIGKVGLTGRTTGPHLHFQVKKDVNGDGNFDDDYPSGMVDPFGWRSFTKHDPWPFFSWNDIRGGHKGTPSEYLWEENLTSFEIREIFRNTPTLMSLGNIEIEVPETISPHPLSLTLWKYGKVRHENLRYAQGTSFLLEIQDFTGRLLSKVEDYITIKIELAKHIIESIDVNTALIYRFDEGIDSWTALRTEWNPETNQLSAKTTENSLFAVFAEASGEESDTSLIITGEKDGDWFIEYPLVEMFRNDGKTIRYSLYGDVWEEYLEPFYIEKQGLIPFRYLTIDPITGSETVEVKLIRIDTLGKVRKTLKFPGGVINLQ